MTGTLYTLGYAEPDATERLEALMAQPKTAIVDIRYAPYSRWAVSWNKRALMGKYGQVRYTHVKQLGNVNYNNDLPIQLLDPEQWVQKCARSLRSGWSLILLCACKDYERCHRKVVYNLIQASLMPHPVNNICIRRPDGALVIECETMDCEHLAIWNCYPAVAPGVTSLQATIALCEEHAREADPALQREGQS